MWFRDLHWNYCVPLSSAYFLQGPKKSFLPTPSLAMAEKLTSPISHQNTEPAKTCEYGIEECAQNEECILESTRSRQGYCRCLKNYQRNAQGVCQLTPSATPSVSAPAGWLCFCFLTLLMFDGWLSCKLGFPIANMQKGCDSPHINVKVMNIS